MRKSSDEFKKKTKKYREKIENKATNITKKNQNSREFVKK